MTDRDAFTHDGRYVPRVGFDCDLMQPRDPSDDEEGPITNEMLKRWAGGEVMHWRDQQRVAEELLVLRLAVEVVSKLRKLEGRDGQV